MWRRASGVNNGPAWGSRTDPTRAVTSEAIADPESGYSRTVLRVKSASARRRAIRSDNSGGPKSTIWTRVCRASGVPLVRM